MEENKSIFTYIGQVFTTYGVIVAIFLVLCVTIGEGTRSISTLYAYGNQGFSVSTLAQLLLAAMAITVFRVLFVTDFVIKNMSLVVRTILFVSTVCVTIAVLAAVFSWFPVSDPKSWISFLVSFGLCSAISILISRAKENSENKKMEQALKKLNQK